MFNKINFRSDIIVFVVPLLMIFSLILVSKSTFLKVYPSEISIGIILDLLILLPFVYFLLIRKKQIPKITVVSVFVLGLVIATYILPENQQSILSQIKIFVLPVLELGVFVFILLKAKRIIKEYRKNKTTSIDFYEVIEQSVKEVFPSKIASFLATEISVVYYGLFYWKKRKLKQNEFTYHKEGTANSVVLGFLLAVCVEVFVVHSMIGVRSSIGSIILGALSAYTALQVVALLRSLSKRPVYIDEKKEQLILKFGILSKATISFHDIKEIEISTKDLSEKTKTKHFSPLGGMIGHNIVLHFNKEITFESFYGVTKKATALAVFLDDKASFKKKLTEFIS